MHADGSLLTARPWLGFWCTLGVSRKIAARGDEWSLDAAANHSTMLAPSLANAPPRLRLSAGGCLVGIRGKRFGIAGTVGARMSRANGKRLDA